MADTRIRYRLHRRRNGIECSTDRENDLSKRIVGFKTPAHNDPFSAAGLRE